MTFDELMDKAKVDSSEGSATRATLDLYRDLIKDKEDAFKEELRSHASDEQFMARTYTL